jgi:hypothetical protein
MVTLHRPEIVDLRGQRLRVQPGAFYGIDHRARVMVAPVNWSKSPPSFFTAQRGSLAHGSLYREMGDPVRKTGFNFIAQARRFMMLGHAGAQNGAGKSRLPAAEWRRNSRRAPSLP